MSVDYHAISAQIFERNGVFFGLFSTKIFFLTYFKIGNLNMCAKKFKWLKFYCDACQQKKKSDKKKVFTEIVPCECRTH